MNDTADTASLVTITPEAEKLMGYCARVSNPKNQHNPNVAKLLAFCAKHGHWSVFEMASMIVEINTTRDISAQILRHRSFHFQEFSQRYSEALEIEKTNIRRQDRKNRQNSFDDLDIGLKAWFENEEQLLHTEARRIYTLALSKGIAKECARRILPLSTKTRLYMHGTIRDFIHYINLRTHEATQKEHRDVANAIKEIFIEQLPIVSEALGYVEGE